MLAMPSCPTSPARRRAAARLAAPVALLLAGLASGCAPAEEKFAPACPALDLVPDAGEVTRFAGPSRDASQVVLIAKITAVPAKCQSDSATEVRTTLNVVADITSGGAGSGTPVPLAYFLALTDGNKVLKEQDFPLSVTLPQNRNQLRITGDDIELLLPVTKTKSAAAYHIYVGFRLSPDDLAYNRSHHTP